MSVYVFLAGVTTGGAGTVWLLGVARLLAVARQRRPER